MPDNRQTHITYLRILTASTGKSVNHKTHLPVIQRAQGPIKSQSVSHYLPSGSNLLQKHTLTFRASRLHIALKQASNTDLLH